MGTGGDGREVQEDRKFMFLQDFQSPGEKNEADVCDDLIQGCPQILYMQSSISLDLASKSVFKWS